MNLSIRYSSDIYVIEFWFPAHLVYIYKDLIFKIILRKERNRIFVYGKNEMKYFLFYNVLKMRIFVFMIKHLDLNKYYFNENFQKKTRNDRVLFHFVTQIINLSTGVDILRFWTSINNNDNRNLKYLQWGTRFILKECGYIQWEIQCM